MTTGGTSYLYVANIRSGRIEVYDTNFKPVHLPDIDVMPRWSTGKFLRDSRRLMFRRSTAICMSPTRGKIRLGMMISTFQDSDLWTSSRRRVSCCSGWKAAVAECTLGCRTGAGKFRLF